jgi:Zn-dependent protease with chaperone function
MSVGEITEYTPESLNEALTALNKLPYSTDERITDIVASSMEFLKNVFTAPVRPFISIIIFLNFVSNCQLLTSAFDLLTLETIPDVVEKYFADSKEKEQISEKLFYISNKVQEYAKKMNLGQIDLYYNDVKENSTGMAQSYATAYLGISKSSIDITRKIFEYSSEEINFIIAHELMHIKHNDPLKTLGFLFSSSILYFLFLRSFPLLYSIPLIMLTNGVASLFFRLLSRKQEKQADEGALDLLQTNTGMIKWIERDLCRNISIKYSSIEELKKLNPDLSIETVEKVKSKITPRGDSRNDFSHPPFSERLAMALAFVPKAQVSQ